MKASAATVGKAASALVDVMEESGVGTAHTIGRNAAGSPIYMVLVSEDPDLIERISVLVWENE